jgi:hypothetical protein
MGGEHMWMKMFVDVACPKSCELGDVHESILNRQTMRGGGDMMGGRQRTVVERLADEDALDQGHEFS